MSRVYGAMKHDEGLIAQTISDLRMYLAAATVKNPLLMIDEFEKGYAEYRATRLASYAEENPEMSRVYGANFYLSFKAPSADVAELIAAEVARKFNACGDAHVQEGTLLPVMGRVLEFASPEEHTA